MKVKSIHAGSAGKTAAAAVAVVAFIVGLIRSLGWLVFEMGRGGRRGPRFDNLVDGPLSFVAFPLFFGLIALVVGFVAAVVFNIAANLSGGIELDVEGNEAEKAKEFDW